VPASGGKPEQVLKLDESKFERADLWPQFLPDGKHFFFQSASTRGNRKASIRIGSLDSKATRLLTAAESTGMYTPPGYVLFVDAHGKAVAQPFDADRLEMKGAAVPLGENVWLDEDGGPVCLSVSRDGLLVCQTSMATANLTWFDRSGKKGQCLGQGGDMWDPRLSPDGQRVAAQMRANGAWIGIWIGEPSRGLGNLVTVGQRPVWSPDGRQIAFTLDGDLYVKTSGGMDEPHRILHSANELVPNDWSPDGRFLIYEDRDPKTSMDLWVLPLDGEQKPRPFVRTDANEDAARFSPDGRWVAYSGIFVLPFPGPGDRWNVTNSGAHPVWSRDGKELYYLDGDNVMVVPVNIVGSSFRTGEPTRLFKRPPGEFYDVSADGKHFLFTVFNETARPDPITLVQNWAAGLKP
jgi:Tol biopolymer transport system component